MRRRNNKKNTAGIRQGHRQVFGACSELLIQATPRTFRGRVVIELGPTRGTYTHTFANPSAGAESRRHRRNDHPRYQYRAGP